MNSLVGILTVGINVEMKLLVVGIKIVKISRIMDICNRQGYEMHFDENLAIKCYWNPHQPPLRMSP